MVPADTYGHDASFIRPFTDCQSLYKSVFGQHYRLTDESLRLTNRLRRCQNSIPTLNELLFLQSFPIIPDHQRRQQQKSLENVNYNQSTYENKMFALISEIHWRLHLLMTFYATLPLKWY